MGTLRSAIRCANCLGTGIPEGGRLSESHVGVRFGDMGKFRIFLDGEDITDDCSEAQAGTYGWALILDRGELGRAYFCPGTEHLRMSLLRGRVEVVAV